MTDIYDPSKIFSTLCQWSETRVFTTQAFKTLLLLLLHFIYCLNLLSFSESNL